MPKEIAVSGVRPTGDMHIGNYLGAVKQFAELQERFKTFFFVADLHALTEPQNPELFPSQVLDISAWYLACGLDPKKTVLFRQSSVPAHLVLAHILGTIAPMGDMNRMTQYKDKVAEGKPANFGLFAYPVLMAADILVYNPDLVPIGEDQVQHLELTRTLARKFNSKFGETFKEPTALLQKDVARVMSLDDPTKKMSKSGSASSYIALIDSPEEIRQKIKSAVTDSGSEIKYDLQNKAGISNLLSIYSAFTKETIPSLEKKYAGKKYGEFKSDLVEILVKEISPIQEKYKSFLKNKKSLIKILSDGAKSANKAAEKTMKEVRAKIGLI